MIDLTNFQALGEYALVRMVEPVEDINVIKIVQNDETPSYIEMGVIISTEVAGDGDEEYYDDVVPGDHILFNKQKALQICKGNDDMYMVRGVDIYGKYTFTEEV